MTAQQAVDQGIRDVRLPHWNEFSWMELPILEDGGYGPWAKLYDPISGCLPEIDFPVMMFFPDWHDDDDRLVPFTGPKFTPDDIKAGRHIRRAGA